MKSFTILIIFSLFYICAKSQDFDKALSTAKISYSAGKLEETHFALQQAMQEVDMTVGKEVLKLLPSKIGVMEIVPREDNVSSNIGFTGATIHRLYGGGEKKAELSIISNSPLIAMTNSILNSSLMAGMMNDGKTKTIKIQGYKATMNRQDGMKDGTTDYELQIPLNSTMITFKVTNSTESEIQTLAGTLPLQEIAKLIN